MTKYQPKPVEPKLEHFKQRKITLDYDLLKNLSSLNFNDLNDINCYIDDDRDYDYRKDYLLLIYKDPAQNPAYKDAMYKYEADLAAWNVYYKHNKEFHDKSDLEFKKLQEEMDRGAKERAKNKLKSEIERLTRQLEEIEK